ncbi:MAG: MBL fold metallo-hydrolase [Pricia sp.]
MIFILIAIGVLLVATLLFMQRDTFGKHPSGARLEVLKKSSHYKDGQFQNLSPTPALTEGHTYWEVTTDYFFKDRPRRIPADTIPSKKTNLLDLPDDENILVWFGHSSYFMQIDGKRFLVDPVFSGNASPLASSVKAFTGTNGYTVADLPKIDYLFISHDHYDHVDHETLIALKDKVEKVICGLGVGAHFESWGYASEKIIEKDWHDKVEPGDGFTVFVTPTRHFSGRGFARNKTLWASYVLQTPTLKIYIGGDSGYDTHFADIGNTHGPFDLVILENGQYDEAWHYIHLMPEEVLKAGQDLKAKRIFPVHSSKFALANHAWDEPLIKITELNTSYNIPLVTPIIGEVVHLDDTDQKFEAWWVGLH